MVCGSLVIAGDEYPVVHIFVSTNVELYIVLSLKSTDKDNDKIKTALDYSNGAMIEPEYIIALYNPRMNTGYGSMLLVKKMISLITETKKMAQVFSNIKMNSNFQTEYTFENSSVIYDSNNILFKAYIENVDSILRLDYVYSLNYNIKQIKKLLQPLIDETALYRQLSFKDTTLEKLELLGFNLDWYKSKKYIPIHTLKEFEEILIPDFINQLKSHWVNPLWESFLITIDFESTGLNTYDDIIGEADTTVFMGISFQDDIAYGVFINMENFENVDNPSLAKYLTNMFLTDPLTDREVTLKDKDGTEFKYKRSQIMTSSHNILIDIGFGLRFNADIWFDYCSMQIGFNADPFFTRGHNGAKDRVKQFLGIEYPDLEDIAGKNHLGSFNLLSDKRVVMLYGCADVDLVRLFTKKLIDGIRSCKDYYGVDQIESFRKYDYLYMNFKARSDYKGVRVSKIEAEKQYYENKRVIELYHNFMRYYIGKVLKFRKFYDLYVSYLETNRDVSELEVVDLRNIKPLGESQWSGKFLLDVLFNICQYPILVFTKQPNKAKALHKLFVPKPAIDVEAVEYYLKFKSVKSLDEIEQSFKEQSSLEDLKIISMYITEDLIDPVTNKVLIDKNIFNSKRYPFFYVLSLVTPYETLIKTDLAPIVELKNEYRYSDTRLTTIVTRRSVNTLCTVSSHSKSLYLPYTDDYYILDTDQSAVEIRIATGLSNDRRIIEPFNDPEKDPHVEACVEIFDKPAYLVDRELERKPVKFIHFGRIYSRGVYTCCKQIYNGDTSAENLATTAYIIELFDIKRKSIIDLLNKDRDEMWKVREIPDFLFNFLKLNPEKKYGRMRNIFGWTQHCEIKDDDEYEASMRRKTGNYSVQGVASTIFRLLYTRMMLAFYKRGWLQDGSIIPHIDIYDEFFISYKNTLDPVELCLIVRDAFLVNFRNFPTLFIGTGIGNTWGEAKSDSSELPILLVEEYKKEYNKGKRWTGIKDHPKFFKEEIHRYKIERVKYELLANNKHQHKVWSVEKLSDEFNNYCVRGYMYEKSLKMFSIKDKNDPIELLLSALVYFVSKYFLQPNEISKIICRDKIIEVNSLTHENWYDSERDLLLGKISEVNRDGVKNNKLLEIKDDAKEFVYFDLGEDEEEDTLSSSSSGDKGSVKLGDIFDTASLSSWDTSKLYQYYKPVGTDLNSSSTVQVEGLIEKPFKKITYNNFKLINNKVTVRSVDNKLYLALKNYCKDNLTTSLDCVTIYSTNIYNRVQLVGKIHIDKLNEFDEFLDNLRRV